MAPYAPGRQVLFKGLKPILYGGREVWPLIEGGKGVSATNHASSGAWAAAGGIGTVSAVNAGAGMPYKLSEIAASYGVNYLPIISSARAFSALWKRAYHKAAEWLGAVVYEDPWLAGGHNGLSNAEDPLAPQDPYPRVKALRETMRIGGIPDSLPIVMAGGVWNLKEWEHWIDN